MIPTLIDKQDSFEIVRDQIAALLVLEIANQQALATSGGKDPSLWKLRVYTERSNAWEEFLSAPVADESPIVNVWFDTANFDKSGSSIIERQKTRGVFNIDCYGYGASSDNLAGGHTPGDKEAALNAQRALRLVRNILMAAEYSYLGLRGLVGLRWIESETSFQPQLNNTQVQQIVGTRLSFSVEYNEFSPQVAEETLEYLSVNVTRSGTGEVLINADYDYTAIP